MTKVLEQTAVEEQIDNSYEIILFNDDYNTFDHVIATLVKVCQHNELQAEQCAIIVHFKGKCAVKTGSLSELKPQCLLLLDAGLSAEIV